MSQKAIKESIEHWTRMLAWAERRSKHDLSAALVMMHRLGETWFSPYCALCCEHKLLCSQCELGDCDEENSTWQIVNKSRTWGTWCKNAKRMIKRLESLLKTKVKK